MLEKLTIDDFTGRLNSTFMMANGVDTVELELIAVNALRAGRNGQREPFSLLFRGPRSPVWPQRTYQLTSSSLGELSVFLVPIGPDDHGLCYEAIFN
jgi:hypothetical protein